MRINLAKIGGRGRLTWEETGGPAVTSPATNGFGSRLIQQLTTQLEGEVSLEWPPGGLIVRLAFPAKA